jgi:hypothetical protein
MRTLVLLLGLLAPALALAQPRAERAPSAEVARLLDRLHAERPGERAEAARALGGLRARDALRPLQVLAQTDQDPRVRAAAAEAVRRIDEVAYAAGLASGDPPPVRPAPPAAPPSSTRPRVLLAGGATLNVLRPGDEAAAAAEVGVGLRWRFGDVQWSLGFPALSLFGQVRVKLCSLGRVVPYLSGGVTIAYNNGTGRDPTVALGAGGGLRLRLHGPLELYAEALANVVVLDGAPPLPGVEDRKISLPVLAGLSLEL